MVDSYPLGAQMLRRLAGTEGALKSLRRFGDWLASEAVSAGAIGPEEVGRLDNRHLADSLAVAECWHPYRPSSIADLGSGAGLPGIPLAILYPEAAVTLVDRSRARCRLLRRAVRVLELPNVRVVESDAGRVEGSFEVVVARGISNPSQVLESLRRLVAADGWGLVLGSRVAAPSVSGFTTAVVGAGILDPVSWILMMDR